MPIPSNPWIARLAVVAVAVVAYFFCYPEDVAVVDQVTHAVSPGMYALIGVIILSATVIQIWGKRPH